MLLSEILPYFDDASATSLQRDQSLASLSPASRWLVLRTPGLRLGTTTFRLQASDMVVALSEDCPAPPVEWWNFSANVHIDSRGPLVMVYRLIHLLKTAWPRCIITHVDLHQEDVDDQPVQRLLFPALEMIRTELQELSLSNVFLGDDASFPTFPSLQRLVLSGCNGTVESWSDTLNKSVTEVEICDTDVFTDTSFSRLTTNSWRRLILDNSNVMCVNMEQLQCSRSLVTLSLINCQNIDALDVAAFPHLELLLVGRTPISDELLMGIEECTLLRLVNIGGCRSLTDLSAFAALKNLRELFAHETTVTNTGIAALVHCENLEKLNLGGCKRVNNVNHLGCLTELKELHLWSTGVTNSGIQGLGRCYSLTELVLDDCYHITDVSALKNLSSLRWLSLIGTDVNSRGVAELINCPSLETLALAGTRVEGPPKLWHHEAVIEFLSNFQHELMLS